ncbi:DUF2201 family putative metallopeptidase [Nonomuraea jabiensis]|uniref:DUF2201 family putative metallopeptidase n=1 Tax=Nonomuraea jabiensis TaxID=882448 RepID=UPI00368DDDF7
MVYGKRGRTRLRVVELSDRRALERWRPADEETVARARRLKEQALLDLGMTHSTIASWIYSKCSHQIPTTAVDTAAVLASGDGTCLLLYNPDFFVALGLEGVRFVLFHEARHLVQRHLFADPDLRDDPVFALACEVTINHVAMVRLRQAGLPEIGGEPVGVDPGEIHRAYRGLRELADDLDGWAERLRRAADESPEGTDASDAVHRILSNAELPQLRAHRGTAARLAPLLPPKLKATYLVGVDGERQRFWIEVFTGNRGRADL